MKNKKNLKEFQLIIIEYIINKIKQLAKSDNEYLGYYKLFLNHELYAFPNISKYNLTTQTEILDKYIDKIIQLLKFCPVSKYYIIFDHERFCINGCEKCKRYAIEQFINRKNNGIWSGYLERFR